MIRLKIIFLILNSLLLLSCSASQVQQKDLSEQIKIVDVQAWINLMPGGPGSFHITGVYECIDTAKCDEKLEIIKVFSDSALIYELNKDKFTSESQNESHLQLVKYNFYTNPDIKLNEKIQIVEKVDVKLIFDFDGSTIEKDYNDIFLTRAY